MSRTSKRATVGAATVAMLVTITLVSSMVGPAPAAGAPPVGGPSGPPGIVVLPTPTERGPTSTRAQAPMGAERRAVTTTSPDADASAATPTATPHSIIGAESVIGADGRTKVPPSATSAFPLSAIGQIVFVQNGSSYLCTGYLIDANSVLTAGHCSFDAGTDDPIESANFFPGRNRSNGVAVNPFGSCGMTAVWAPVQWRLAGKAAHDYSVQQLDCTIGTATGWFGMFALDGTNAFAGRRLRVEGYPGDRNFGSRWRMAGLIQRSSINTLHYPMDTAGGQSGSPLFKWNRPSCGGPCSAGVHAYGAFGSPPTNSGPRLTAGRIGTITAVAASNGG